MDIVGLTTLLKTKTTSTVYADFIPEGKELPAVSFTHIANGGSRILKGHRTGLWDTWRVLIVGKNRSEIKSIADQIKTVDNASSDDFQRIFVMSDGGIPALPDDKTRTSFVDIKTYG